MKVYTRKGDSGQTSIWGGRRMSKDHERVEAIGAGTRRRRGPSVAVRGNADGAHRPPQLCTPTVLTVHTDRPNHAHRPS